MLRNYWLWFFLAGLSDIITSLLFVYITQYYTEYRYRPVRSIAQPSQIGPATTIITGFAVGLECTPLPTLLISAAEVCKKTDRLDAVGDTTKALTKGYAIGSAALAAFLLCSAYMDEVTALTGHVFAVVNLPQIHVFIGGLLGAMLVCLFSALAIRAVGRTAYYVINEVRRQFRESPGIMRGEMKPDYARCVDIVTAGALREMAIPKLLAVGMPIAVGLILRAEAVAALLMVGTITGILMATLMNNSGGTWDNAKKYIESGVYGGKGSETHKAAVVGDTVGDPFKDTAGPSLHVLIKLLSPITLVMAPLFI
jgi:K(+)-stimulated pyrophosphate-energized sodium pump